MASRGPEDGRRPGRRVAGPGRPERTGGTASGTAGEAAAQETVGGRAVEEAATLRSGTGCSIAAWGSWEAGSSRASAG